MVREKWIAIGVKKDLLEFLVNSNLHCVGKQLYADAAYCRTLENPGADCGGAIMDVLKVKVFVASRWMNSGEVGRAISGGCHLGLEILFYNARCDPKTSEYYAHGIDRLTPELRRSVCVFECGNNGTHNAFACSCNSMDADLRYVD